MNDSAVAIIGKSVQIRGEVNGSEDLVVDGHVEGTITLVESRLTIGPNAHVAANVSAFNTVITTDLVQPYIARDRPDEWYVSFADQLHCSGEHDPCLEPQG